MERTSTVSIKIARSLCGALGVISLYRAATQSVTPGEAWNYDGFIGPTWTEAFSRFDVNNHVLYSLLAKISTEILHHTELAMRLPSLLAGFIYLWIVFRIARRWFGDGAMFLAVFGLLTLNPMVVDALSEGRGYGMAMACWMVALELILESEESFSAQKLNLAATSLGLSVVASLAFLAPAVALLAVLMLRLRRSGSEEAHGQSAVLLQVTFLITFILLVIPLNHAAWGTLAVGATSLRQTINQITVLSLVTSIKAIGAVARVVLGLAAVAGAVVSVRCWRRRDVALAVFTGACLAITLLVLMAAHRWLATPFPEGGAIYLIPITTLSVTAGILKYNNRAVQIAFLCVSGVLLTRYITELPFGMYVAGKQFAGGRALAKSLRAKVGGRSVRIGCSVEAEPVVRYYRRRYRQANWQTIETRRPNGTYDYYVLTAADTKLVEQRHLSVVYRDAGLTLAR
jgi:hypothetical protein